jgi:hypothetical protein
MEDRRRLVALPLSWGVDHSTAAHAFQEAHPLPPAPLYVPNPSPEFKRPKPKRQTGADRKVQHLAALASEGMEGAVEVELPF